MINGYALADEIFNKIGKNEKHEATIEDALRIISFYGFNEEASSNSKIGLNAYWQVRIGNWRMKHVR